MRNLLGLSCLTLFLSVTGCGSGGEQDAPSQYAGRVLSGNVSKGPLSGATIRVFQIDARGQSQGEALAQTLTDDAGDWSLALSGAPENLIIESSGGIYVDEADPETDPAQRRRIQLAADESFSALLSDSATSIAINIFTDALLRKSRLETQGAEFFQVYALNRSFFTAAFGFDITTVMPANPVAPAAGASPQSRSYAMALGGVANAVNSVAIANQLAVATFDVIVAVMDDLTDCTLDGRGVAGPVPNIAIPNLSLNTEILRFRNNNFSAYDATALFQIEQSECARSGRIADTIAPVFTGLPTDLVIEAGDNQGVAATASRLQNRLQSIQAIDDRDGLISFDDDLPAVLPLGDTVVTYTASDLAGNTGSATLTITVIAPEAPVIIAPSDVVARATGPLTQVYLGIPQLSDNVSAPEQLQVSNNAPTDGFASGQHEVTWTVTDEAGLRSQDVQQVIVEPVIDDPTAMISPSPAGPDYTQLPILPGPDDRPVPPVTRPTPNTVVIPATIPTDTDGDGLPDYREVSLGTDVYQADSDQDGVSDGMEVYLSSDPLVPSVSVTVAVGSAPGAYQFSLAGTTAQTPAFIILQPGLHDQTIRLEPPCDHVMLIGNLHVAGDSNDQAQLGGANGVALSINGCQGVGLQRLVLSDNSAGAIELIDANATIHQSAFFRNTAVQGGAISLLRSQLTIRDSILKNNSAVNGGAVWIGRDSYLRSINSFFGDNYSSNIDNDHSDHLYQTNSSIDVAAVASQK